MARVCTISIPTQVSDAVLSQIIVRINVRTSPSTEEVKIKYTSFLSIQTAAISEHTTLYTLRIKNSLHTY